MVKKENPALITKLDFPLLPLLVLATAFVLLLLTLSRYYQPAPSLLTYENKTYNFEFQYPPEDKVEENQNYIQIGPNYLYLLKDFSEQKLREQQEACKDFYQPDQKLYQNSSSVTYYKVCDGHWIIYPSNPAQYFELRYSNTSDQILSTFTFIY